MKHLLLSLTVAALFATGCATEKSNAEKLTLADEYLSEHGGETGYRAAAYDLYKEVLEDPDNHDETVRANFGVGMIGFLDLVQGVPRLLMKPAGDEESGDMPPADALARTIDALVHEVIDRGIVQPFDVVRKEKDFHFNFKSLAIPSTDPTQKPVDLSGEWDLGEIGALYGVLQTAVGAVELVWSYNQVPETVLKAALSDADVPEMPTSPGELPQWATQAAEAVGLTPLPWLQKDFGTLRAGADLEGIRARIDDGTLALADSFKYTQAENDDQSDDVFPNNKYVATLIKKVIGSDDLILSIVGDILTAERLEELARAANTSVHEDDNSLLLPDFIFELLGLAGAPPEVIDPVAMRLPGLKLSSLFTHPVLDLKDTEKGLLPYFKKNGEFVVHSEQEDWTDKNGNEEVDDGEFEDTGVEGFLDANFDGERDIVWRARPGNGNGVWNDPLGLNNPLTLPPLGHESPTGRMERANDIVDPVYVFFGDASFGGFLTPTTTAVAAKYQVDTNPARKYENPDLMRLTSSLIWLIDSLGI